MQTKCKCKWNYLNEKLGFCAKMKIKEKNKDSVSTIQIVKFLITFIETVARFNFKKEMAKNNSFYSLFLLFYIYEHIKFLCKYIFLYSSIFMLQLRKKSGNNIYHHIKKSRPKNKKSQKQLRATG